MERAASLRVLEISPGSSWNEIKEAYRDLIQVWHPDRFEHNPKLRGRAERKTRELNAAFEDLRSARVQALEAELAPAGVQPRRRAAPSVRRHTCAAVSPSRRHPVFIRILRALVVTMLMPLQLALCIVTGIVSRLVPAAAAAALFLIVLQALGAPCWNVLRAGTAKQRAAIEQVLNLGLKSGDAR